MISNAPREEYLLSYMELRRSRSADATEELKAAREDLLLTLHEVIVASL